MKSDLNDITFLLLVRLDTIERLENTLIVTDQFCKYFNTNIVLVEAAQYQNHALRKMLNRKIHYTFIEDKDPVLYRTRYYNHMAADVSTPYLAIWDADIPIDKNAIIDSVENLRKGADVAYPYNGFCMDVCPFIRTLYLQKKDIRILHRNANKMRLLHNRNLVGGAVFVRTDKYRWCGMENEKHYGWGNEDFDRYYRFSALGMKIYRTNTRLFHLYHPRIINSGYRSALHSTETNRELNKIMNSSQEELLKFYR